MVKRKRFVGRTRTRRKKRYAKTVGGLNARVDRCRRAIKALKKMREIKATSYATTGLVAMTMNGTTTGHIHITGTGINAPTVGTGDTNRIGDEIRLSSLVAKLNTYGPVVNTKFRIVIAWSKHPGMIATSVLQSANMVNNYSTIALRNFDKRKHIKVLYDKVFQVNQGHIETRTHNIYLRLGKRRVQYSAGGTTINEGELHMFLIMDDSGQTVNYSLTTRLNFYDD